MFNLQGASSVLTKVKFAFAFCFLLFAFSQCAQIGEPVGGDSDVLAPQIIPEKTAPINGTVNFSSSKITIEFDEYIQVKSQQIIITPALSKKPDIKAKGKKIEIEFTELPQPNTTYTVNLSGAVSDITENNVSDNLQYVFSTGNYLDSISLSGKVINAFSQNGAGNVTVILHAGDSDTSIKSLKPDYFLKTAKDGSFRFDHLKTGKYRIYAIADRDADLLYDDFPEEIGFLDSALQLDSSQNGILLSQFKPLNPKVYCNGTVHQSKSVEMYRFTQSLGSYAIEPINGIPEEKIRILSKNNSDSVFFVHLRDSTITDTIRFKVYSNDEVIDTLAFTAHLNKRFKVYGSAKLKLQNEFFPSDSVFIYTSVPMKADTSKITLTDTLTGKRVKYKFLETDFGLKILIPKTENRYPLRVSCAKGALVSTDFNYRSEELSAVTMVQPPDKTGSITLKFPTTDSLKMKNPVCVLLMEGKYFKRSQVQDELKFELLKPGNYTFYIFDDRNGSMDWTPGDFKTKTLPEKIKWYPQGIKVKANWEQDITWM